MNSKSERAQHGGYSKSRGRCGPAIHHLDSSSQHEKLPQIKKMKQHLPSGKLT